MKKMIITIILLIIIAIGFIVYKNYSDNLFLKKDEKKDTSIIVKNFINTMIPHHQEAIDSSIKVMSDLDITEPKVRIFAANVVDIQSFEISKMKNIYSEFLGSEYVYKALTDDKNNKDNNHGKMIHVDDLKGDDLAKKYTKDMIKHHEIAIKEAKYFIKKIDKINKKNSSSKDGLTITNTHPAIEQTYQIAKDIVESQTKEIEVLKSWYK